MKYRRIYLAYGSNINLEQMARRCPTAKVLESKMLQGHELEFRGVATIVPKKGAEVPVLIWEIGERDEIALDRYEGFPSLYRKEIFEMKVGGNMCTLELWDTAGQEVFKSLVGFYARDSAGAFVVFDLTSKASFDCVSKWLKFVAKA